MSTSHPKGIAAAVFGFLRAHAGKRFTPPQLARQTGFDARSIQHLLTTRYHDGRYRLQRERTRLTGNSDSFRFWLQDPLSLEARTVEENVVGRWMLRHDRAVRPSVIAKAVDIEPCLVARILDRWTDEGKAVRCFLPLRRGHDRYEYRLAQSVGSTFGGRRLVHFGNRVLA